MWYFVISPANIPSILLACFLNNYAAVSTYSQAGADGEAPSSMGWKIAVGAAVVLASVGVSQESHTAHCAETAAAAPSSKVPSNNTNNNVKNTEYATREAKTNSAWTRDKESFGTYGGLKLFTGNSNKPLADDIASHLGINLGKITVGHFADGEVNVVINENVRGKDVYIVQPTSPPVNETLMELLLMISTMRRASAQKITAVIPYVFCSMFFLSFLVCDVSVSLSRSITACLHSLTLYDTSLTIIFPSINHQLIPQYSHYLLPYRYYGYARQDRKLQARVPISAADVARLLEAMGVDRVVAVDLHCGQIQGFFGPRVPVDNLDGGTVGVSYFGDMDLINPCVVSPDAGGVYRAKQFRDGMSKKYDVEAGLAMIVKQRSKASQIDSMDLVGNVDGCDVIIVDDMVDTAGTLCKAAGVLKEKGARRVFAFASHGVFSGPAASRISKSALTELVVLDTVPLNEESAMTGKITQLSVGPLLAQAIYNLHNKKSISALFK
jgi:ribose-phosphate pyrophosphokinase